MYWKGLRRCRDLSIGRDGRLEFRPLSAWNTSPPNSKRQALGIRSAKRQFPAPVPSANSWRRSPAPNPSANSQRQSQAPVNNAIQREQGAAGIRHPPSGRRPTKAAGICPAALGIRPWRPKPQGKGREGVPSHIFIDLENLSTLSHTRQVADFLGEGGF